MAWAYKLREEIRKVDADMKQTAHAYFGTSPPTEGFSETNIFDGDIKTFLRQAKTKYDPSNFFHMNANIFPEALATE